MLPSQLFHAMRTLALVAGAGVLAVSLAVPAAAGKRSGTGCTRTNVYWTHNTDDPAWAGVVPNGPSTAFFLSGRNYEQMLKDNTFQSPYNELALDYIAAELNVYAGASMPADVIVAFLAARDLFDAYTPGYDFVADPDDVTEEFEDLRALLSLYNRGKIGPGSCGGKKR